MPPKQLVRSSPIRNRGEYIELGVVWVRLYVPAAGGLEAVVGLMQTPVGGVERVGIGGAPEATCTFPIQQLLRK